MAVPKDGDDEHLQHVLAILEQWILKSRLHYMQVNRIQ